MTTLIDLSAASERATRTVAAVVASLPDDFRVASEPSPGLVVVSGESGWVTKVTRSLRDGAGTVMVLDPGPADAGEVDELASSADAVGATVVFAERYAGDASLNGVDGTAIPSDPLVVTARSIVADGAAVEAALLELVRVLHAVGIDPDLDRSVKTSAAALVTGTWNAARVTLVATAGPQAEVEVHVTGADRELSIRLWPGETARPAEISSVDAAGGAIIPGIYESAYRTAFRELSSAAPGGAHLRGRAHALRRVDGVAS